MKIAFIAKMRAGKDTVAEYLISKHGGEVRKFADPLYEIQTAVYKILDLELPASGKDRVLLQVLGTEWGRTIDPDLWVKSFEARLTNQGSVYVTDLRFENELASLRKLGFKIVYIEASDDVRQSRGASHETHISEKLAQKISETITTMNCDLNIDYILYNNGTFDELYAEVDKMVKSFGV